MTERARIKTGVPGLDTMLYGGIPTNNQVLIAGGPGAGKTLLSMEILYHNAKNGVPAAYIALEERTETVIKNFKETFTEFSDVDSLISGGKLIVGGEEPASRISSESERYSFGNVVSDIETIARSNNAQIVVIDSMSLLKLMLGDTLTYSKSMIALISNLRRIGVTTLLITEMPSSERKDLRFSQEFFIFDGIVTLYQNWHEDKRSLTLEIIKMRGSNHSLALSPYEITPQGFKVFTIE